MSRELKDLLAQIAGREGPVTVSGLRGSARALLATELLAEEKPDALVFVTATSKDGDPVRDDLASFLGYVQPSGEIAPDAPLRVFPRHDVAPYDRFSPQPFVTAARTEVLHRLLATQSEPSAPTPVILAPFTALFSKVPAREVLANRTVSVATGEELDRDALLRRFIEAGYARQPVVEDAGDVAARGGIVDVFPPHRGSGLRLEFFGDEVESIREMDPASQRSGAHLERAVIPPARELLGDRELIIARDAQIRALAARDDLPESAADAVIDALLRGHIPPGAESLADLLQPQLESFFAYLPERTLIILEEPGQLADHAATFQAEIEENYEAAKAAGRLVSPPEALFLPEEAVLAEIEEIRGIVFDRLGLSASDGDGRCEVRVQGHEELSAALKLARRAERALVPLVDAMSRSESKGLRVSLCASTLSGATRLGKLLSEYGYDLDPVRDNAPLEQWATRGLELRVAKLSSGFSLPAAQRAIITEEEIFGAREKRRRGSAAKSLGDAPELADLANGDLLVHAEHGIGIYRGLVPLTLGSLTGEFLRLEYEGGDRLFLPVHRLNLVQRYVGADGGTPKIDRLGGVTWEKTKRRVKKSVLKLATELVSLQAKRELARGFAFSERDASQSEFEASFTFEETPDQLTAIEDTLEDMARQRPMDRLVCGDVGYGKTEVAIRAAFRAVMDGKQVALLVPTTVLCQQHFETFRERFAGYPVVVESLSRFRSPKESRAVLEGMASGRVDIVIGTHRLLQKGIAFRDLGLLIVDEEHRFGVTHKERIKKLRTSVDVLTLTATPIPRTLQMAFSGLRDLSVIHTPPPDRLSIRTQVSRFDEALIREAILREVRRGGQVFFVHNRVHSIEAIAELLRRIAPDVSVMVAHGQMNERELEDRMLAFARGKADVLLCTTIIESGLDLPNANTMLIDRADAMGLAQLYQLRGRIGRGGRRAYAYLLVPGEDALTEDATRRLEAIRDLTELGSGFRLANLDLEIRGAGNLLGPEQSGNLGAVGYETYMGLLEETVEELRGQARPIEIDPEVRLPVTAQFPESYVADVGQRLVLYKRLASAPDEAAVGELRDELLDRYGPLPEEAENLMRVLELKICARDAGIACVDFAGGELILTADDQGRIDPTRLLRRIEDPRDPLRMSRDHKLCARVGVGPGPALFEAAKKLIRGLV
ncbi:MAG: transcription-repair coupling factor [Myxococcales bacterium]|nr:transcription-repair coupling factor [Myxococcales bacterium]